MTHPSCLFRSFAIRLILLESSLQPHLNSRSMFAYMDLPSSISFIRYLISCICCSCGSMQNAFAKACGSSIINRSLLYFPGHTAYRIAVPLTIFFICRNHVFFCAMNLIYIAVFSHFNVTQCIRCVWKKLSFFCTSHVISPCLRIRSSKYLTF